MRSRASPWAANGSTQSLKHERTNESALDWKRWYFDLPDGLKDVDEVRIGSGEIESTRAVEVYARSRGRG